MTDSPVASLEIHFRSLTDPRAEHSIDHRLIYIGGKPRYGYCWRIQKSGFQAIAKFSEFNNFVRIRIA